MFILGFLAGIVLTLCILVAASTRYAPAPPPVDVSFEQELLSYFDKVDDIFQPRPSGRHAAPVEGLGNE